jgi:hypothetical protein
MDISLPWIDAAYLTPQALPKYIYLFNEMRVPGQEIVYL